MEFIFDLQLSHQMRMHQESCFSSSGTSGRVMYVNYNHDILFVSLRVCIWLLNLVTKFQVSFTLLLGTSIHLLVTLMRDEQLLHVLEGVEQD
jgi:hypothetical protein